MTKEQIRASEPMRQRMMELLGDDVMQTALVTLRDGKIPYDLPPDAPDIASVRMLSRLAGYQEALFDLVMLSRPLPIAPGQIQEDWGATIPDTEPTQ